MKFFKYLFLILFVFSTQNYSYSQDENIESYTANWADIVRAPNGKYRVLVKYSNIRIGEYRDAYADFDSKKEAIDVFQKLVKGAEFYWGEANKIQFKEESTKVKRF